MSVFSCGSPGGRGEIVPTERQRGRFSKKSSRIFLAGDIIQIFHLVYSYYPGAIAGIFEAV